MSIKLYDPFVSYLKNIFNQMANVQVKIEGAFGMDTEEIVSYGVSSIITCTGKIKGRILLDMEPSVALAVTQNITGLHYASPRDPMVLATISEMNNIIVGGATSVLNNNYSLGLWLAPPYVFSGRDAIICIPKIASASLNCSTKYGKLKLNIAFEKGVDAVGL